MKLKSMLFALLAACTPAGVFAGGVDFIEITSLDQWDADRSETLQVVVDAKGGDQKVTNGDNVTFHYTGWLFDSETKSKGNKFDSSKDRNQAFTSKIGVGRLIKGWDLFIPENTAVGEQFSIVIPPELGYGSRGAGGVIPPNATLVFEIEILATESV